MNHLRTRETIIATIEARSALTFDDRTRDAVYQAYLYGRWDASAEIGFRCDAIKADAIKLLGGRKEPESGFAWLQHAKTLYGESYVFDLVSACVEQLDDPEAIGSLEGRMRWRVHTIREHTEDAGGPGRTPNDAWYLARARDRYHREGAIEVDEQATVSHGADNGAYVQAWVWVENDANANAEDHSAVKGG